MNVFFLINLEVLLWERGGNGGASSELPSSGQEFLKGVPVSVGVAVECLNNLGDGGFVKERSLECVGFGGSGISQISVSLKRRRKKNSR